jgi:hypothetical protein
MKRIVYGVIGLFCFSTILFAGTAGKVAGRVIDARTKEPLVGANVIIEGTLLGASTDAEGDFYIINIPVGKYTMIVSYVGYGTIKHPGVRIILDQTTKVNFQLTEDIAEGETIVVTAESFKVQKDETTKKITIQKEDIQSMPVQDFSELVTAQAGVIKIESSIQGISGFEDRGIEEIHVRGGRSGEIGYTIDGMYILNPFYGSKYRGTELNLFAVEQMDQKTGVFDAEYGWAMSCMINYITRDGGDKLEGNLKVLASNPGRLLNPWTYFSTSKEAVADLAIEQDLERDYREVSGGIGGPVPFTNNKLKFIITGHKMRKAFRVYEFDDLTYDNTKEQDSEENQFLNKLDTIAGWHAMGFDQEWDIYSKLTWAISNNMKMSASFWNLENTFRTANLANVWAQYYEKGRNIVTQSTDRQAVMFNHQLSNKMFYDLRFSRLYQKMFIGVTDNGKEDGRYLDPDEYEEWDTDYENLDNKFGWEFQVGGHDRYWHTNYAETYEGFLNFITQATKHHQVKFGGSYRQHEIMIDEVQLPWLQPPYTEKFKKHPKEASVYIQDLIEYDYMTIHLGLRCDFMNVNDSVYKDIYDIYDIVEGNVNDIGKREFSKWEYEISPRIGFSHVITDNATFTFSYGKLIQPPTYRNKYINSEGNVKTRVPIVGYTGLTMETMTAYEFGVNVGIGDGLITQLIGWSKEYSELTSSEKVVEFPYSYSIMTNVDYATSRGIDINIRKMSRNYSFILQYTYSRAMASRKDPWEGYRETHTWKTMPKREILMSYDRTHDIDITYLYRFPENSGPNFANIYPLENTRISSMLSAISGFPYTPIVGNVNGETNSERGPWNININMNFQKYFKVFGYKLIAGLMIRNLLDKKNPIDIWPQTGKPDDPGKRFNEYVADGIVSKTYFDRPYNYGYRRQINFSLEFVF